MKKQRISLPAIGGSSLLVIFAVLCLTVFALLSLSSVQAQKRIADATADAVTEYYAAELQAQTVFARLRSGQTVEGVRCEEGIYEYCCRISEHQVLEVELKENDGAWTVLRWQAIASADAAEAVLPVWDGK